VADGTLWRPEDGDLRLALRRLAESERRAAWWRSQGEADAANRYAAEAGALLQAVRTFGGRAAAKGERSR
jgi:NTP pyrophosphatase (non-canonical NTP hydrolase)